MPFNAIPHGALPPEAAFNEGDAIVIMVFPKPVLLSVAGPDRVNPIKKIYYPAGVHNVPEPLADHWWLKAHGAVRHKVSLAALAAESEASAAAEVASAQPSKPKKKG
jgi:hypothetical protein